MRFFANETVGPVPALRKMSIKVIPLMTGNVLASAAKNPFPCEPRYVDIETNSPPNTKCKTYLGSSFISAASCHDVGKPVPGRLHGPLVKECEVCRFQKETHHTIEHLHRLNRL